jgi:hypothetical protein
MEPTGRTVQGASPSLERPAFYALRPGGWRDLVTLLHPPYTAWAPAHCLTHWRAALADGSTIPLDAARLAALMERALQVCAIAMVLLATGLVLARL